jgi:hypothetical protein
MKRDGANKLIPVTAITDEVVGLSVPTSTDGDTLTGWTTLNADHRGAVYTNGSFFADRINFATISAITGDDAANRLRKDALFDGTGIIIRFNGTDTGLLN